MPRVDVHAHWYPPSYLDLLEAAGQPGTGLARRADALDEGLARRFDLMDAAGVDLQVLSVGPQQPYLPDVGASAEAARVANADYHAMTERYPSRFRAFACLPLPHVDAALAELATVAGRPGFVGVTLGTSLAGRSLSDPALEPLFAEFDRRGTVVFLHPVGGGPCELSQHGLTWLVGAPVEDTVAALHLVLSGVVRRWSRITFVVPHLGGVLPFLLQRIDDQGTNHHGEHGALSDTLRGLWYDTVNSDPAALRCAATVLGTERIVLGTDYPYLPGPRFLRAVRYIADAGLTPDQATAITDTNAARMLDLTSAGPGRRLIR